MRIAIFIDGKNFYSGWRDAADNRRIDFTKLSKWLVEQVGGEDLWAVHYYTSVNGRDEEGPDKLGGFLDLLESHPGYFVHRLGRKVHLSSCQSCGADTRYTLDKEVDTTLVSDMIMSAATGAYDACILLSGDADHAPAAKAVTRLGKKVYVGSWGGTGVSLRIRRVTFDHVDLVKGLSVFERTQEDEEAEAEAALANPDVFDRALEVFEHELKIAEEKFSGGYVGLGYFVTRWRSAALDSSPEVRRRLLDTLVDEQRVEIYSAEDGAQAIRLLDDDDDDLPLEDLPLDEEPLEEPGAEAEATAAPAEETAES
ncbi:MAG: NYN domain-containing protein [Deltaproteobacteria bacterium]|nr:NYN domain-containing protein [Deltaproteobacteria bacterium]